MLPIITFTEVWQDVAKSANSDYHRAIMSRAWELLHVHGTPTIGQAWRRASIEVRQPADTGDVAKMKRDKSEDGKLGKLRRVRELPLPSVVVERKDNRIHELRERLANHADGNIVLRWANGDSMADIAESECVSTMTISRTVRKVCEELRAEFA